MTVYSLFISTYLTTSPSKYSSSRSSLSTSITQLPPDRCQKVLSNLSSPSQHTYSPYLTLTANSTLFNTLFWFTQFHLTWLLRLLQPETRPFCPSSFLKPAIGPSSGDHSRTWPLLAYWVALSCSFLILSISFWPIVPSFYIHLLPFWHTLCILHSSFLKYADSNGWVDVFRSKNVWIFQTKGHLSPWLGNLQQQQLQQKYRIKDEDKSRVVHQPAISISL